MVLDGLKLFATRPGRHVTAARGATTEPSPFAPHNVREARFVSDFLPNLGSGLVTKCARSLTAQHRVAADQDRRA
jgi:hypothetical protein